jgi:uncharacterized protein (TIGR03435 family)
MSANGSTVDILVNQFLNSGILDRAVVDHTGLTGTYDFNIEYNHDVTEELLHVSGDGFRYQHDRAVRSAIERGE